MYELIITSDKECTTIPCETKEAAKQLLEEHLAIDARAIVRKFGYEPIIAKSQENEYIMLITYSFTSDYISISCKSEEEAKDWLEKYLEEDILAIRNEYEPIVRRYTSTNVELIYEESGNLVSPDTDIASYRVIRANNVPKVKVIPARYSDPRVVETNHGTIPLIDYLEIVSSQHGFDSYKDLRKSGLHIKVRPVIEEAANS